MQNQNILEIKDISKTFDRDLFKKKQVVLDHLSLQFPEGHCTALMGHNGAGKTTTIRTIFGLIKPDQGDVLFRGRTLVREDKRMIGYMPETNKLPLNLTCEEILWHQLRVFNPKDIPHRQYKDLIEQSLREIKLWDHRKKKVGGLSKGMGRRLSWAQATIHKPELIILDEPMSGLDPLGHRLMVNLINNLRHKKTSVLLCTHELWSVQELCDDVHIIKKGKLIYSTLSSDLQENGKNLYLHKIIMSGVDRPNLETLKKGSNLPDWTEVNFHGQRTELHFRGYSEAIKWLQVVVSKGIIVVGFNKISNLDENHLVRYFDEEDRK